MTEPNKDQILNRLNELQEKAFVAGNVVALKNTLPALHKIGTELADLITNIQNFLIEHDKEEIENSSEQPTETINL